MIYTGMMPGEAMALKVDMIDIEGHRIHGAGMKTKVRKTTDIVLAEAIIPLVQDLIDHAQESGYIWKRVEKDWYDDYYGALEDAGCRRLTPYSCRHTTATALAVTKNIAPQTVKKVMRWSTTAMLDRYAHPDQKDALKAVNRLKKAR
jgi:integrase